jgi:hypothetical protein
MRFSKKNIRLQNQKKSQINKKHRNLKGGAPNLVVFRNIDNLPFLSLKKIHQNFSLYSVDEQAKLTTILSQYDICFPPNATQQSQLTHCRASSTFQKCPISDYNDLFQRINAFSERNLLIFIRPKINDGPSNVIDLNFNTFCQGAACSLTTTPKQRYEYDSHWTNVEILDQTQQWTLSKFVFDSGNDASTLMHADIAQRLGLQRKPIEAKLYSISRLIDILNQLSRIGITFEQIPKFGLHFNIHSLEGFTHVTIANTLTDLNEAKYCVMKADSTVDHPVILRELINYIDIIIQRLYSSTEFVTSVIFLYNSMGSIDPSFVRVLHAPSSSDFKNIFINFLGINRVIGIGGVGSISVDYVDLVFRFTGHVTANFTVKADITTDFDDVLVSVHAINRLKDNGYDMTHKKHTEYKGLRRQLQILDSALSSFEGILRCPKHDVSQEKFQQLACVGISGHHLKTFTSLQENYAKEYKEINKKIKEFKCVDLNHVAICASSAFSSQSLSPPASLGTSSASGESSQDL